MGLGKFEANSCGIRRRAANADFQVAQGNPLADDRHCCSEQDQVVPVDQFGAVDVAEQGFDVVRAVAGDAAGFGA